MFNELSLNESLATVRQHMYCTVAKRPSPKQVLKALDFTSTCPSVHQGVIYIYIMGLLRQFSVSMAVHWTLIGGHTIFGGQVDPSGFRWRSGMTDSRRPIFSNVRMTLYYASRDDAKWRKLVTWCIAGQRAHLSAHLLEGALKKFFGEDLIYTSEKLHGIPYRKGWSVFYSRENELRCKTNKGTYLVSRQGLVIRRNKDSGHTCDVFFAPVCKCLPRTWFVGVIEYIEAYKGGERFRAVQEGRKLFFELGHMRYFFGCGSTSTPPLAMMQSGVMPMGTMMLTKESGGYLFGMKKKDALAARDVFARDMFASLPNHAYSLCKWSKQHPLVEAHQGD